MARVIQQGILAFLLIFIASAAAWAQATAQLSGTVKDESGGVLPGVSVTATQTNTGFSRTVVTEANGSCRRGPTASRPRFRASARMSRPASSCRSAPRPC